ncbi:MAG: hypothetical protein FWF10_12130 [Clostridiales bacterium]|nr:hypothetical protein [Clostridiales bacterium]
MKHLYRILLPTALLLGLLLAPAAALAAARDAAALWWARVFPALTPYLLVCGLLEGGWRGRRGAPGRWGLVPIFLFGAVGGYPAGAKLLGGLALPAEDARRMAIFCNLCSPGFLLSIIALGSYGDKRIALPLFLSGFIPALLLFVVYLLCNPPLPAPAQSTAPKSGARLWTDAITGAMRSQLVICGCLVSCAVIAALLCATGLPALLARLFHADARLMEMLFSACWKARAASRSRRKRPCPCAYKSRSAPFLCTSAVCPSRRKVSVFWNWTPPRNIFFTNSCSVSARQYSATC